MEPQTRENYNTTPGPLPKQDVLIDNDQTDQISSFNQDQIERSEIKVTSRCAILKVYLNDGSIRMKPVRRFDNNETL